MARHVFVDNSNIYGGAQRAAATLEPNAPWMSVRLYYKNFFKLIERGGATTRVLAGSVPPGAETLWQTARDLGYSTDLLQRVEQEDGRLTEQAVDETLHLKMALALLDHEPPQTLVIASGDGQDGDVATSFPALAERALKKGWDVEVWSWRDQLTGRYNRLARAYPGRVTVKELDQYYKSVTFLKPGTFKMNSADVRVAGRVVSPCRKLKPQRWREVSGAPAQFAGISRPPTAGFGRSERTHQRAPTLRTRVIACWCDRAARR